MGLTPTQGITIDPVGSKDLDDALWVERREGQWHLSVFVAAPGLSIEPHSETWKSAIDRAETRYFASGRRLTMLGAGAEERHSLTPSKHPKEALLIKLVCDAKGHLLHQHTNVSRAKLTHLTRLHYPDVPKALRDHNIPQLAVLKALCIARIKVRAHQGALVAFDDKQGMYMSGEGAPIWARGKGEAIGHLIVQECMILGNHALAHWCAVRGLPVLFRNHQVQQDEEMTGLRKALKQALKSQNKAQIELLGSMIQSSLGAAQYGPHNEGHWALGLSEYMHATSPLRRASDLVNQHQIFAYLEHAPLPLLTGGLVAIGEHLGESRQKRKEARAQQGREEAKQEVIDALDQPSFHTSSPSRFSRFVKTFVRHPEQIEPHTAWEVFDLWDQKNQPWPMPVIHALLYESNQEELHERAVRHLIERPFIAKNLLLHRTQKYNAPSLEIDEIEHAEVGWEPKFFVPWKGRVISGHKKSLVEQRLTVAQLASQFGHLELLPQEWFTPPEQTFAQSPMEELPNPEDEMFMTRFYNWTQRYTSLHMSFAQQPDQSWQCDAHITWDEEHWHTTQEGSSKTQAKHRAFMALRELLLEEDAPT